MPNSSTSSNESIGPLIERQTFAKAVGLFVLSFQEMATVPSAYLSVSISETVVMEIVDSMTGSDTGEDSVNSIISFPCESSNVIAYHDWRCSPNGTSISYDD